MPPADVYTHKEPLFTAQMVADCVTKIVKSESYGQAALRLQCAARAQGGSDAAVEIIEQAYAQNLFAETDHSMGNGKKLLKVPHLADEAYITKARSSVSWCRLIFSIILLTALVVYVGVWGFPGLITLLSNAKVSEDDTNASADM